MKQKKYVYDFVKATKNTFQYYNSVTGAYYLPKSEFPDGKAPAQITATVLFGVEENAAKAA